MTDIVKSLRCTLTDHATDDEMWERVIREREEAADEITRLRAANERLRGALDGIHIKVLGDGKCYLAIEVKPRGFWSVELPEQMVGLAMAWNETRAALEASDAE